MVVPEKYVERKTLGLQATILWPFFFGWVFTSDRFYLGRIHSIKHSVKKSVLKYDQRLFGG